MSPIGSGGTLFSGKMKNINSLCDCQSNREEEDEAQDEDQDDNDYYDEGGGVSSNMLLLFATSRSWWHMVAQLIDQGAVRIWRDSSRSFRSLASTRQTP